MKKTVDYFELCRIVSDAQGAINARLHEKAFQDDKYVHDYIKLTYLSFPGHIVELQVNFACLGAVTPERAVAYGEALVEAAEFCRDFEYNGCEITYDGRNLTR